MNLNNGTVDVVAVGDGGNAEFEAEMVARTPPARGVAGSGAPGRYLPERKPRASAE